MFLKTETLLPGRIPFIRTSVSDIAPEAVRQNDIAVSAAGVKPRKIDRVFFVCFAVVGLALPTFVEGSSIINAWWTIGFAYALTSLLPYRKSAIALAKGSLPFVLLLAIIAASTMWSDDPSTTMRRALALLGSGVLSFWVVLRLGLKAFVNTLGVALIIVATVSLILVLLVPSIGIMPSGEWQGMLDRKNTLGQLMLLGIITVFCSTDGSVGLRKVLQLLACAFLALMLFGARSGTSTFITVLLGVSLPVLYWSRSKLSGKPTLLFVLGFFAATTLALMSTVGQDIILNALGKDETLTTRTDVWQYVNDGIQDRPLTGHGYKVFWLSHGGAVNDSSKNSISWATQAHNGYLETELDIGYIGLFAVCLFLFVGMQRSMLFFWRSRDLTSAWPLLVIVSFIVLNVAEATFSKYYDVGWIVFGAAFLFATEAGLRRRSETVEIASSSNHSGKLYSAVAR